MGLLDTGGFDDPGTLGLLSFGARMSNAPGGFMRALGPSVLGALNDRGQAKQDIAKQAQEQLRMQLLQQQMMDAQAKRQQEADAQQREAQFREYVLQNPIDMAGAQRKALELGQIKPMDFVDSLKPQARKVMSVAPGNVVIDEATGQPMFTSPPKPEGLPEGMRMGLNGPEWIPGYLEGRGQVARQGASSVSYGAPVAGVDASGNPIYFQPDKAGGKPSIIPGVAPPPAKLGEGAAKQVAGIDSLSEAIDSYVGELAKWKKADALSPDKRAAMGTAYNNMMLQAKEAYNLGVLNGPDYTILQSVVRDPTNALSTFVSNDALGKQALTLKDMMSRTKRAVVGAKAHANDKPSGGIDVDAALQKYVK